VRSPIPPAVRAVLQSLDDPEKLLGAILDHAVLQSGATRGLVFDHENVLRCVGYSHTEKLQVWRTLGGLLLDDPFVMQASERFFGALQPVVTSASGDRDGVAPAIGLASVLMGKNGTLAVVAIEKEAPLEQIEIDDFADWVRLSSNTADLAICYSRWSRAARHQPLRIRDLPVADLAEIPNLDEMERILVAQAMSRNQNNKGRAAAALGISRENLRRKLLRYYFGEV
jgi:hypothetical protein